MQLGTSVHVSLKINFRNVFDPVAFSYADILINRSCIVCWMLTNYANTRCKIVNLNVHFLQLKYWDVSVVIGSVLACI